MELKKLLFADPLPSILFTGEKNKTFRVTGGERYEVGDKISLSYVDNEEFAQAIVVKKTRKRIEDLTKEDWEGHERFKSNSEMYSTYSNWARFSVTPKTELDIIEYSDFKLTGSIRD